ncbi:class I SAM-dependent methyltransferase [Pedobacter paludis]|uniref:Methyltransferase type 11 n=1 Tax=Pedobacter paludis TaxID=2203212 RepID=A0A317F210_9SPHI|nr:methyltransferase domain-containing protein [Pedobacter paludis]PWS33280.1 methyltransferase type 11 [Pedobacter paludis]
MPKSIKEFLKRYMPDFFKRMAYRVNLYPGYKPSHGNISWGDFDRTEPFSNVFGFDRGGPVDRYYIDNFLASEADSIFGNVLEVADNAYTLKYGGNRVIKSDVLHVNKDAPGATYIADLSKADSLPSDYFDCIILTQTLQFIFDYSSALKHCYRMLKKGGSLLVTVPGISPIERGEWHKSWLWSFNEALINKIFTEICSESSLEIKGYGNVYAAVSFLHGVGLDEVDKTKLDIRDNSFDVIISIRLTK